MSRRAARQRRSAICVSTCRECRHGTEVLRDLRVAWTSGSRSSAMWITSSRNSLGNGLGMMISFRRPSRLATFDDTCSWIRPGLGLLVWVGVWGHGAGPHPAGRPIIGPPGRASSSQDPAGELGKFPVCVVFQRVVCPAQQGKVRRGCRPALGSGNLCGPRHSGWPGPASRGPAVQVAPAEYTAVHLRGGVPVHCEDIPVGEVITPSPARRIVPRWGSLLPRARGRSRLVPHPTRGGGICRRGGIWPG